MSTRQTLLVYLGFASIGATYALGIMWAVAGQ